MVMPVLNFDQGAGLKWLQGTGAGANIMQNLLDYPNKRAQLAEQLKATELANTLSQQKAAIQPQTLEAQLQSLETTTKLKPLMTAITAQNALNEQARMKQMSSRFSGPYQMRQLLMTMSPGERATWRAQNPTAYDALLSQAGNAAMMGGQQPAIPQLLTKQLFQAAGLDYAEPENPNSMQRTMPPGAAMPALPIQNAPQPAVAAQPSPTQTEAEKDMLFNSNPDTVAKLKAAAEMEANKDFTSSSIRTRRQAGEALDALLNNPDMQNSLQTLARYESMAGAGKAQFERVFGPKSYAEYQAAYTQLPAIISGSLKSLEGFGATDKGMQAGIDYFKMAKKFYKSDPQAAIKYMNLGIQKLNAESEALKTAASPLFPTQRLGEAPIKPLAVPTKKSAQAMGGRIRVRAPNGQIGTIPSSQLNDALSAGYKEL